MIEACCCMLLLILSRWCSWSHGHWWCLVRLNPVKTVVNLKFAILSYLPQQSFYILVIYWCVTRQIFDIIQYLTVLVWHFLEEIIRWYFNLIFHHLLKADIVRLIIFPGQCPSAQVAENIHQWFNIILLKIVGGWHMSIDSCIHCRTHYFISQILVRQVWYLVLFFRKSKID